jgi:hypothetical protein
LSDEFSPFAVTFEGVVKLDFAHGPTTDFQILEPPVLKCQWRIGRYLVGNIVLDMLYGVIFTCCVGRIFDVCSSFKLLVSAVLCCRLLSLPEFELIPPSEAIPIILLVANLLEQVTGDGSYTLLLARVVDKTRGSEHYRSWC